MLKKKTVKRLKKVEMLEIMRMQAEEIDTLKLKITALESQLANRRVKLMEAGTLAEASLKLTNIFEEAQKAADIYLENVKHHHQEEG